MTINIAGFVTELTRLTQTGQTTEHSFRPALATLLDSLADDVNCINEPKAITNVGRPDFVLERSNGAKAVITVGHVEAKDINLDIHPNSMRDGNKSQWERYTKALPNLIYTNGLDFAFYKNGELAREISIGDWLMGVQPKPENYTALANQLKDFAAERLQTITSAERLAEMMAGKAVLIKDVLFNTLQEDVDLSSELAGQFKAFKSQLIHDLDGKEFADIYAETIAYGMFAARLHDETLADFTRTEALDLLPKSNPFLRKLFEYVAGPNLANGLRRTVDEMLMASYAMCHMKLDMMLTSMGYKSTGANPPRLGVYLTNSLEEGVKEVPDLYMARWLSQEARLANTVKNDKPIMCIIGNPPYSGISQNMGDWIVKLIEDYKYVDGKHFGERKHWLHDDYVKFIRLSEHLIEKNGEGVLGFITNHGYLDNPTFRGMRWHLLNSFDKIWVLDLHGNSKKKEVAPDGSPDKNVFDIQQGVALIIAVKKSSKRQEPKNRWQK